MKPEQEKLVKDLTEFFNKDSNPIQQYIDEIEAAIQERKIIAAQVEQNNALALRAGDEIVKEIFEMVKPLASKYGYQCILEDKSNNYLQIRLYIDGFFYIRAEYTFKPSGANHSFMYLKDISILGHSVPIENKEMVLKHLSDRIKRDQTNGI